MDPEFYELIKHQLHNWCEYKDQELEDVPMQEEGKDEDFEDLIDGIVGDDIFGEEEIIGLCPSHYSPSLRKNIKTLKLECGIEFTIPQKFVLTKNECDSIANTVSNKRNLLKRNLKSFNTQDIFKKDITLSTLISNIEEIKLSLLEKEKCSEQSLYIVFNDETLYPGVYRIGFYCMEEESDDVFKERFKKLVVEKILKENNEKYLLLQAKEKRKLQLKKLIEEMGVEIYDVFKEIKDN